MPPAMVKAPVPSGPAVKASATPVMPASRVVTLVLPLNWMPPAESVTPPLKVLAPPRPRTPLPVLVMPPFVATAVTLRVGVSWAMAVEPLMVTGAILKVRATPPRLTIPVMVATEPAFSEVAVTVPLRVRVPAPVVTLAAVE